MSDGCCFDTRKRAWSRRETDLRLLWWREEKRLRWGDESIVLGVGISSVKVGGSEGY